MGTSKDKFLSHHISRKIGLSLASTETRTGREGYKLMRRTVRRGDLFNRKRKKQSKGKICRCLRVVSGSTLVS